MNSAIPAMLYLARHGRTSLNADGLLRGRLDPELDEVGQLEAAALGAYFSDEGLTEVVSSPLRRAVETASAVASRAGVSVEIDDRLIDRDYGPWAGLSLRCVSDQWGSLDDAPGVESATLVLSRSMAAVHDAALRTSDGAVLLVSHDAINQLILKEIDRTLGELQSIPQATGCFNTIAVRSEMLVVLSVNNLAPVARSAHGRPDQPQQLTKSRKVGSDRE